MADCANARTVCTVLPGVFVLADRDLGSGPDGLIAAAQADGRLIAAAPDLLAACEAALEIVENSVEAHPIERAPGEDVLSGVDPNACDAIALRLLRAALARAKGAAS